MNDLISRAAALDIYDDYNVDVENGELEAYRSHRKRILALPSAQKNGHWIDEGTNYSCSECHRGCWVNSNYCPWCGADMR